MKRFIAALTALVTVACTFTACGSSDSGSDSASDSTKASTTSSAENEDSSKSDASENSSSSGKETTTAAKTTGKKQSASTEPEDPDVELDEVDEEVEDALNDMIDSVNNCDVEDYLNYQLPEKLIDPLLTALNIKKEDMLKEYEENSKDEIPLELVKVVGVHEDEDMLDEAVDEICKNYEESKQESDRVFDIGDLDLKEYLDITDVWTLEVTIKNAKGEEETNEFLTYYLEGEGWKFDTFLFSSYNHVKSSKKRSMNASASSLQKAASTALCDVDVKGVNIEGKYIISSEDKKDKNLPEGMKREEVLKLISKYADFIDDMNWFVVVEQGECVYAVCQKKDSDYYNFGTYPADQIYVGGGKTDELDRSYSYDEVYYECTKALK